MTGRTVPNVPPSEKAQKYDVVIAIENSNNFGKQYIQNVLDKAITYPNIKLTWDTGHDGVSGYTDREYLMRNSEHISHMHFMTAKENQIIKYLLMEI